MFDPQLFGKCPTYNMWLTRWEYYRRYITSLNLKGLQQKKDMGIAGIAHLTRGPPRIDGCLSCGQADLLVAIVSHPYIHIYIYIYWVLIREQGCRLFRHLSSLRNTSASKLVQYIRSYLHSSAWCLGQKGCRSMTQDLRQSTTTVKWRVIFRSRGNQSTPADFVPWERPELRVYYSIYSPICKAITSSWLVILRHVRYKPFFSDRPTEKQELYIAYLLDLEIIPIRMALQVSAKLGGLKRPSN